LIPWTCRHRRRRYRRECIHPIQGKEVKNYLFMMTSFIIHFKEMYPGARWESRLPKDVSHRLAYAKANTWYEGESWLSIQHCDTKHVYLYYLEVNTAIPLYLPVEVTFADVHWQFALQGGYGLY